MAKHAATEAAATDSCSYKRLTDAERVLILKLHEDKLTQVEIAQRLNRSQSTISEVVQTFTDTTISAKRYLAGRALKMAENIVECGMARDHVQVLNGLGVLNQKDTGSLTLVINGLTLAGTGRTETVEGQVLSPPLLTETGESGENR